MEGRHFFCVLTYIFLAGNYSMMHYYRVLFTQSSCGKHCLSVHWRVPLHHILHHQLACFFLKMQKGISNCLLLCEAFCKNRFLNISPTCQLLWLLLTSCDSLVTGQCKCTSCSALTLLHTFTPGSRPLQPQSHLLVAISETWLPCSRTPQRLDLFCQFRDRTLSQQISRDHIITCIYPLLWFPRSFYV